MNRRRALIAAQSDILWEWNPSKGTSNIEFAASSGETPNYEVLSDCIRLYGPNASSMKWTGINTKEQLGLDDFTVEVYFKNLSRKANGSVGVIARTHGAGASSGHFCFATYYATNTSTTDPVKTALRGATEVTGTANSLLSSGVVKCHINRSAAVCNATYPTGDPITTTPNTASTIGRWICAVETNRKTYYADITRIVVRRGDTT